MDKEKEEGIRRAFLIYMPVYHRGWQEFFARFPDVKEVVLLDPKDLREWAPTHKDLHGLEVEENRQILQGLGRWEKVEVMTEALVKKWQKMKDLEIIISSDEAVEQWLEKKLGKKLKVNKSDCFLRWTNKKSLDLFDVKADETISKSEIKTKLAELIKEMEKEGQKSSDWWRRVGCVLLLPMGERILAHNAHLPEAQTPYINGDVRAQFHKGDHFELTTAIHAEAKAIAEAAKKGWQTEGAEMMVTDFPCPVCAKLIGQAGIKTVYYRQGYAMLDGEIVLKAFGVKLVKILD